MRPLPAASRLSTMHGGGHRQQRVGRVGDVADVPDRHGQVGEGEGLDQRVQVVGGLPANRQGDLLEVHLMAVGVDGEEGGPAVEGGDLVGLGAQQHDAGRVVPAEGPQGPGGRVRLLVARASPPPGS